MKFSRGIPELMYTSTYVSMHRKGEREREMERERGRDGGRGRQKQKEIERGRRVRGRGRAERWQKMAEDGSGVIKLQRLVKEMAKRS